MDKKRKKGITANKRTTSPPKAPKAIEKKVEKNVQANELGCDCQSMVRITGHIGVGDDNRILLRCGVEGTKVSTKKDLKEYQKSTYMEPNGGALLHTVTQGTQMDGDLLENRKNHRSPFFNSNLACFCDNVNEYEYGTEYNDHKNIKRCQSPLVVITVYPNDERCENVKIFKQHPRYGSPPDKESITTVNHMPQSNRPNQYQGNQGNIDENKTKPDKETQKRRPRSASRGKRETITEKQDTEGSSRPRSRSRSTHSSTSQKTKQGLVITGNANRPKSPNRISTQIIKTLSTVKKDNRLTRPKSPPSEMNQKIKRQEVNIKNISVKNKTEQKNYKSPNSLRSRSPSIHSNQTMKLLEKENKRTKELVPKKREFQRIEKEKTKTAVKANLASTSTNTDHELTKKTLVDTFIRELIGQMGKPSRKKNKKPLPTESQVTINIDGENENYDVFLQQGRVTDVRVKKSMKSPFKYQEFEHFNGHRGTSPSMLNMVDMDNFMVCGYESPNSKNDNFEGPEINIRDSLEIGHKRKERHASEVHELHNFQCFDPRETRPTESFAPVKHFTGDKCLIADPVKRDREIRHLLGLELTSHECYQCPCPCPCPKIPHRKTFDPDRVLRLYHAKHNLVKRQTPYAEARIRINQVNYLMKTAKQSTGTQYEKPNIALDYSNLPNLNMTLNRNIQVFLQVEKYTEQKPITLSRKQYNKVKRAIDHTISKHRRHKLVKPKCSFMALDVKKKTKIQPSEEKFKLINQIEKPNDSNMNTVKSKPDIFENRVTNVLYPKESNKTKASLKHYVSSEDMRMSHYQPFNGSSTKVAVGSSYSHSIHTIFKGFRKPRTPNLGTSACSFFSDCTNDYKSVKNFKPALDKPRKPFLKRLMSCLILKASTTSEVKLAAAPKPMADNSTVDSYHISTSMGAIEMSSSIYDTSESFYSNHSIIPINNKIKRGFFGSMRGLLAYGKT
ncbi:uncharacterized protein LOC106129862 [Amyelois transitella]|uniref:uncharacterized protein LOC106129862 n=1 Tax=Amyelois transitella TaxID=680683 RepID=UPI0029906648|nr:uncharacterized protein LOC106129862 [Amyelois transitella]